jgi:transcriptional regulator with XRE-family HTH domain
MLAAKMDTPAATSALRQDSFPRLRSGQRPPGDDDGAVATIKRVASRLRDARQTLGMTLDELSASSGVSRTALSQIERQKTNPSLTSLWKIAAGLGLNFLELLDSPMGDSTVVVRANGGEVKSPKAKGASRLLAPLAATPWGQALEFSLAPNSHEFFAAYPPGTRELVVALDGPLRVILGRSSRELGEGDSLVAFADVEHGFENVGAEVVRFHVFVLYPR